MTGLDPDSIREVMNKARREGKDPADGFILGISIVLGSGVAISLFSFLFLGEKLFFKSIWTYLEGGAAVYAACFLILLTFFLCGLKRSAQLAAQPAIAALWPLALGLVIILYLALMAFGLLILIVVKLSGKKDFAWGTGSLVDIFTVKWWKSKGWRPPPSANVKDDISPSS